MRIYDDPDLASFRNPRMEALMGERLRKLGFKQGPTYIGSPDGIYYNYCCDDGDKVNNNIQLVVVGAMHHMPFELSRMVGAQYMVSRLGALPGESDEVSARTVRNRGYWTILLRTHEDHEKECERVKQLAEPGVEVIDGERWRISPSFELAERLS